MQYFIEMSFLNNTLFLRQNFCFPFCTLITLNPFLSQIEEYSKQLNPFINGSVLLWASIFVSCFNTVLQFIIIGVWGTIWPNRLAFRLPNFYSFEFLFVINHIRRPNESNLLNYFTLSFLHKRLRGRKWSAWALSTPFCYISSFNFEFMNEICIVKVNVSSNK